MRRLFSPLREATHAWTPARRLATGTAVIAILLTLAAFAAWTTGRSTQPTSPPPPDPAGPSASPDADPPDSATVRPPKVSDPLAFAKAAAAMLWTYDTRSTTREEHLAALSGWMTDESAYGDWNAVSAQVPDPVLWSRMADNGQFATAEITEAHFPAAFKQALAEDPAALTEAYLYAVTVTGSQRIAWKDGGAGAEDRAITLAVQCRPDADCALASIAPRVAP
jgi:hypothetical protein